MLLASTLGRTITIAIAAAGSALGWACSSASADVIRLSTGETLNVKIVSVTDDTIRFVHPVLGEMSLPRKSVEILPPPAEGEEAKGQAPPPAKVEAAPQTPPATEQAPAIPPAPPEPPKEWKFKLTLAAAGATGNSENANIATKFTAVRETPRLKTSFDTGYFFSESDSVRSQNAFTAGARNDWLNPDSKWFYFVDARYDYDEFQSWDQRVNGHVGVGYKLIEPPNWRLNLIAGIGAVKEFGSDNDDVRPEALFGVEGEWTIAEKQSLKFDSTVFPDLSDIGEYRWVSNLAWSMLIDEKSHLSLTAGLGHEYQSQVDPGRKHNDLRVFAGIDWDF